MLRGLAINAQCNLARNLLVLVRARTTGADLAPASPGPVSDMLLETLQADPLDWCARHLLEGASAVRCDAQAVIDLAIDYVDAGAGLIFFCHLGTWLVGCTWLIARMFVVGGCMCACAHTHTHTHTHSALCNSQHYDCNTTNCMVYHSSIIPTIFSAHLPHYYHHYHKHRVPSQAPTHSPSTSSAPSTTPPFPLCRAPLPWSTTGPPAASQHWAAMSRRRPAWQRGRLRVRIMCFLLACMTWCCCSGCWSSGPRMGGACCG